MTTYRARIIDKRESGNLIRWTGLDVEAAAFIPTGTAAPVNPSTQVVRIPGATQIIAADLPPLREQDFGNTGYYGAAAPLTPSGWPGAAVWRKPDGASEYAPEVSLETAAVMGGTLNALHQHGRFYLEDYFYSGLFTDNCGYIDVALTSGSLSSCTHDEFVNLEQVALVGEEIIAFRDVELVSTNVYRLRTFLRGLQATEWFARIPQQSVPYNVLQHGGTVTEFPPTVVEGHAIGDRFLLLTPVIRRFVPGGTTTPVRGMVRGITRGASIDSAGDTYMPQSWATLVPPHPSHLSAYKSGIDQLTVDFCGRSFIGVGQEIGIDPTIPDNQQYLISVSGGPFVVGIYVIGEPPFVVTDTRIAEAAAEGGGHVAVSVRAIPQQFPNTTSPVFEAGSGWRVNGNPLQIRYASPRRHIAPAVQVDFS